MTLVPLIPMDAQARAEFEALGRRIKQARRSQLPALLLESAAIGEALAARHRDSILQPKSPGIRVERASARGLERAG